MLTGSIGRPVREPGNSQWLGPGSRRWALLTGQRTISRIMVSSGGGISTG